jgi:hypothetical protein
VTTTVIQTVAPARSKRQEPDVDGGKPVMIDSCHAFAGDGPVVKRQWPEFYTGED